MFDIFRSEKKRAIDALAIELADDIRTAYPLDQQAGTGAIKGVRKVNSAIDKVCAKARSFHAERKLDLYGKARLNNTLLWQLKDSGYESDFTDEVTKKVIISMTNSNARR